MSESSGAVTSGVVILEECPEGSREREQDQGQEPGPLRCGGCTVWPRQQTWLCVVPLLIGFIGLGLSLMLLKWIVVGSVRDYVPTDLVDAKGIGQDPMFPPHLSKPSTFPKNSDTTTTTTTTMANPTSTTVTAVRGRTRTVVAHHPSGTTTTAKVGGASGSQVTPRSTTQRQGNSGGGRPQGPVITTTTAAPVVIFTTSSPSPFNPTVLHDSTEMWTHKHSTERPATNPTRTHVNRKTSSPTIPQMRSEHFKQCHVKDLAYCLNDGECFVIETLSGPHKHCRCKEGYQGIRCDQFLPKTDSILSDPNHLGIEFMESKEVYKRQVLSITCITMGISVLGILCMALYCRNKRCREKLQAHLKESRSLKNYSGNASALESKSSLRPDTGLQLQNYCKRSSQPHEGAVCKSSFSQCNATPTNYSRGPGTGKHYRSSSLSHSPDQISKATHWSVPRKTPPIPRGRRNPIGGSKNSGPAYQHLQELESSEREVELLKGYQIVRAGSDPQQDAFLNMQPPMLIERSWESRVEVRCSLLNQGQDHDISTSTRTLRCPRHPSLSSPSPFQTCSIPIIPSVQGNQDEVSCLQTTTTGSATCSATPSMEVGGGCSLITLHHASTSCSSSTGGQQQDEMALILEEAQEHLRALTLANRKQEESGGFSPSTPRETVCFLTLNGGGVRGLIPNGPIETQLLSPREPHTDSTQPCQ
ncbi:pro-neuregulin-3, membrane-bound isoform isoform X2 [Salmo salar]|uniref:Pro-neuregulin-3, membrane-bound isoform n=1 Tax=Salmo salar TaxID=8030 RepID=A0A1S3S986_SALSA|nr:pro-neuregulin-3, membrane-bound isoform-like isoform X2 [Salmo salar]|eukprot:XP_014060905.1 PREDICTED: pro-neuregulin-3, membrane-bound isoform-like isoform X2 [Salmo salar]